MICSNQLVGAWFDDQILTISHNIEGIGWTRQGAIDVPSQSATGPRPNWRILTQPLYFTTPPLGPAIAPCSATTVTTTKSSYSIAPASGHPWSTTLWSASQAKTAFSTRPLNSKIRLSLILTLFVIRYITNFYCMHFTTSCNYFRHHLNESVKAKDGM